MQEDFHQPPDSSGREPSRSTLEEINVLEHNIRHFLEVRVPAIIANQDAQLRRLAGAELTEMLESRDEAVKRLHSASISLRNAAYQILLKKWKLDPDILPECISAIQADPDIEVRFWAMCYFAAVYRATCDQPASRFLSKYMLSEETPTRMRNAAYFGLLKINGLMVPKALARCVKTDDQNAFADIDWQFVHRFA